MKKIPLEVVRLASYINAKVKKGQALSFEYSKEVIGKKSTGYPVVTKESKFTCQLTNYTDRKPVKERIKNGGAVSLPKHIEKAITIGNARFWVGFNGKWYFPCPLFGLTSKVKWFHNGKEIPYSEALELCGSKVKDYSLTKKESEERGQAKMVCLIPSKIKSCV